MAQIKEILIFLTLSFCLVLSGDVTFYNSAGYGACGTQIDPNTQELAAVSQSLWTAANANNDPLCSGMCVQVTYQGKTVKVPIKDKCGGCASGDVDLSVPAFQKLADTSVGRLKGAQTSIVKCQSSFLDTIKQYIPFWG